ncbi:complex I NDUFA9 subunit family protein [Pseudovibrio sp. SPO723]|uniref:complex I NDUFA9 subunit family protein n=1 Tax=Nesiotobacter zosterae TaxID=392721 RepID=UPI0029C42E8B|nr:complex I NDUFA9 subunit family protein [Pseudovibrio sp. SPO723]MDX5592154.1 complex I NDUFA9 subunit family protein [Pseudovibrio sp. SPO723]
MATALNGKLVTVFGGSGFLGRHIIRALALRGYRVRAAVRRPENAEHLQPLGVVGQIMPVQANIRNRESVENAMRGSDAVINLVGILHESGKQTFEAIQASGAKNIADACAALDMNRVIHVSAIGADANSKSAYARSKAAGENAFRAAVPDTIIFRPSVVFGPEDDFFNRFGAMSRIAPALPLVGGGKTKFQPVFVGDVAEAIAKAVEGEVARGTTYELGGPEVASFRECLELMLKIIRRRRMLGSLSFGLARFKARFLQILPNPPLTVDQVELLRTDNVVSAQAIAEGRTLEGLGINAHSMEAILPSYMEQYMPHGQYDARRPVQN